MAKKEGRDVKKDSSKKKKGTKKKKKKGAKRPRSSSPVPNASKKSRKGKDVQKAGDPKVSKAANAQDVIVLHPGSQARTHARSASLARTRITSHTRCRHPPRARPPRPSPPPGGASVPTPTLACPQNLYLGFAADEAPKEYVHAIAYRRQSPPPPAAVSEEPRPVWGPPGRGRAGC